MKRTLLVFIDGVGLGDDDPASNTFVASPPPVLTALLGGSLITRAGAPLHSDRASLVPLDAQLGIEGLPQSGTGQFSLFTGENGAQRFGRHFGPWVPTALREPLRQDNVLTRAQRAGQRVAFANAYPEELLEAAHRDGTFSAIGPLRAGPPLVAIGAGVLVRHTEALQSGAAISSEITNEAWRTHLQRTNLPRLTARQAGHNLARIANAHDLTLFAHYNTDYVGHEKDLAKARAALLLVDAFLGGVLAELSADVRLVVASDHGNLEDATTGHTRNPALGLFVGPGHEALAGRVRSITDVAGVVGAD